ncbi:MAG: rod shape-determining protein RodA [Patescibacteria group bacterium]|nr:rod shape-determining protein RodA [Patescibacteria group bacterium]
MNSVRLKRFDFTLFFLMIFLIIFGLVGQYSLSLGITETKNNVFLKQTIFALVGLFFFVVIFFIDFRFTRSAAYLIYLFTFFLLVAVLIFGHNFRGVKGWFNFGFFNFQPAELAKLSTIIILAKFWQEARRPVRIKHLIFSFILICPFIFLIIRQPDLGSALMILIVWFGIFFLVDKNKKHLIGLLIVLVLVSSVAWFFFLEDYQKDRILTYLNPQNDPLGRGYQITQSIVAVGSGQFFGRGFGLGSQSQLKFLPDGETDFIFAVLAEEFGLIGCLIVLGLYTAIFFHLIRMARMVYDNFGLVLILGTNILLFSQMFINVGMNIGLVPVVGVPLPFISYGGSSLLISLISFALIESTIIYQPFTKYEDMITL